MLEIQNKSLWPQRSGLASKYDMCFDLESKIVWLRLGKRFRCCQTLCVKVMIEPNPQWYMHYGSMYVYVSMALQDLPGDIKCKQKSGYYR